MRDERVSALNAQVESLGQVVADHLGQHPAAEILTSLPGLGFILGARILGEFGDDPDRYVDAKARKAYAGTAPITRASRTKKIVMARYARNKRLGDAAQQWRSPRRAAPPAPRPTTGRSVPAAPDTKPLTAVANRWIGMLHGCLKTGTLYDETNAWNHTLNAAA